MHVIARIRTDFPTKFGIPRQSGLADALEGRVVFEPAYRNPDALRGLEGFSHIWLLWEFSEARRAGNGGENAAEGGGPRWSATVRPPRLGGNARVGVFATRSPFRPNPIGLSCVRLARIEWDTPEGAVLVVRGADLLDGTPIWDIKPYLPYADSVPDAAGGFASAVERRVLRVEFPRELLAKLPARLRTAAVQVLAQDPRPSYQDDPERVYGMPFGPADIRFRVAGEVLTVTEVKTE